MVVSRDHRSRLLSFFIEKITFIVRILATDRQTDRTNGWTAPSRKGALAVNNSIIVVDSSTIFRSAVLKKKLFNGFRRAT